MKASKINNHNYLPIRQFKNPFHLSCANGLCPETATCKMDNSCLLTGYLPASRGGILPLEGELEGVAVLMITYAVIFNACSKQETSKPASAVEQPELTSADQLILKKIFDFKESMQNLMEHPGLKSTESTSVDSAVWYLDATLNLSHSFISWDYFMNFQNDSVFVSIPRAGEDVNYNDLAIAYEELKLKVAEVCLLADGNDNELYTATLVVKEEDDNTITLKANTTVGCRSAIPDYRPFDEGWMYGDGLGDCTGYNSGEDACTQLTTKTNQYRYLYINDEQMMYYGVPGEEPYTTIYSYNPYFNNLDDPDPEDNNYERLLVYQDVDWGYIDCIDTEEMNWYYHKLNDVIYDMVPSAQLFFPNAYGKTFIHVSEEYDPVTQEGSMGTKDYEQGRIYHQYRIEYRYGIYVGGLSEPTSIIE